METVEAADKESEANASFTEKLIVDCKNVRFVYNKGMNNYVMNLLRNKNAVHTVIAQNMRGITENVLFQALDNDYYSFFPMNIVYDGSTCSFDVRFCHKLLLFLFQTDLRFKIRDKLVIFTVHLECHAPTAPTDVDLYPTTIFNNFLKLRYNPSIETVNLDNYQTHPSLSGIYFFGNPLKYLHEQVFCFAFGHKTLGQIKTFKLSNNNIKTLLGSSICNLPLRAIDLRNNQIEDIAELTPLKSMNIKELWLDGNPLCKKYPDEGSYMEAFKQLCPVLEKLDGARVVVNGIPFLRRNYICSANADKFVDQFLEQYYTIYDYQPRDHLIDLYHSTAMFSLSVSHLPGQLTSGNRLHRYSSLSRNLLKLSDFSKSDAQLYKGSTNIIAGLMILPVTEHDPYSFTVDVAEYSSHQTTVTVTGVFRHPRKHPLDLEPLFGFCRTFRITCVGNDKYQITNDILCISNATPVQTKNAFKFPRRKCIDDKELGEITECDREDMCSIVSQITGANLASSKKCLEVANWDVKEALKTFLTLFKNSKIAVEKYD